MQKEYKSAMEKISLSESDKVRILANVKKASESRDSSVEQTQMALIRKRPVISLRRMGTVAACVALCIGTILIYNRLTGKNGGVDSGTEGMIVTPAPDEDVVWEELESIEEIGEKTDCKTYTLSNVPRKYRLKKIEVANAEHHVRLTYRNKKEHDKILFEYKESEDAAELLSQFNEEETLSTEVVGDADVTMYGEKQCSGMTWKKASCTFAVRMTKACSKKRAKALVYGTAEGMENAREVDKKTTVDKHMPDSEDGRINAVGWYGDEEPSGPSERQKILKRVFNLLGFRITIVPPGERVIYKLVEDYESFAFTYPQDETIAKKWIVGYAGWGGCPDGVLDGYEEVDVITVNGMETEVYNNKKGDKLFRFNKQGIDFTILIPRLDTSDYEQILEGLYSVLRISMDDGVSDDEPDKADSSDNDKTLSDDKSSDDNQENKVLAAQYREIAMKIQDAVSERSLQRLISYMDFPLTVDNQGTVANSAGDLQALEAGKLFTSSWVDAVVSYDVYQIHANTKSFIMGNDENSLHCKIREGTIVITEIHTQESLAGANGPKTTPSAE